MSRNSAQGAARRNRAQRKILDTPELRPTLKAVIQTLINRLNHNSDYMVAWPSAQHLAKTVGVSKRTIQRNLEIIRRLGIFKITHISPRMATQYLKDNYGLEINLNRCRNQAPPIYEVNDHELWDNSRKLSKDFKKQIRDMVASRQKAIQSNDTDDITQRPSKMSKVMTRMSSSSNDTGVIQKKKKKNVSDEPSPFSLPPVPLLGLMSHEGVTVGRPDRVYAINRIPTRHPDPVRFQVGPENSGDSYWIFQPTSGLKAVSSQANSYPFQDYVFNPEGADEILLILSEATECISEGLEMPEGYSEPILAPSPREAKEKAPEPPDRESPPRLISYPEPEEREPAPTLVVFPEPEEREPPPTLIPYPEPEEREPSPKLIPWPEPEEREPSPSQLKSVPLSKQLKLFRHEISILISLENEFCLPDFPIIPRDQLNILTYRFQNWLDHLPAGTTPLEYFKRLMRNHAAPISQRFIALELFRKRMPIQP